ncbi:SRPBCC family protein [Bdellovibrio sp. HCB274]|uniref:SRPBCC family protein n=1 Tax=Bdellovibrio sp. HCB274 TaxID=3394361 RepID=UPI0039B67C38
MQTSQEKGNRRQIHKESTPQAPLLVIEREFDVPVSQLFAAFSDSDSLKEWWWPQEFFADEADVDFREGGEFFISMDGGGTDTGIAGGMTGRYEEIVENKRIVMTDQFADKEGNAITPDEAGMPGDWSEMAYITFEFDDLGGKRSRFRLSHQGVPAKFQQDCIQGWSESFDKLEKYLRGYSH